MGSLLAHFRTARSVPSIYATDPTYGAVGDYNGTQNTAGTGTDSRAAIQAALDSAYTQGSSFADTTQNVSYRVVIPKGKYYISARSDGLPSLSVPLGVVLDFSEAELHFDRPPLTYNSNTEPNTLWCGILIGQYSGLIVGKMQMKPDQDQTYGGTWYGMNLDAIRVQESTLNYIVGGGRGQFNIIGFRGAAIRIIACYNTFIQNLHVAACNFGVVQSYFGTAFDGTVTGQGYTRYRGSTIIEGVCTSMFIHACAFTNIYKKAILCGVNGDYTAQGTWIAELGGLETTTQAKIGGGPISITQTAFENIAEEVAFVNATGGFFMSDIRIERSGWQSFGSATIIAGSVRSFKLTNITWQQEGGQVYKASYTGALAQYAPNPSVFARCNATNVSPVLDNVYINNNANLTCQLIDGNANITRLPTIINYKTETATQMQGTSTYLPTPVPNQGGQIYSASTGGVRPTETVNGVNTEFTFQNGFTRSKPSWIRADGLAMDETNSDGTTNWTWSSGTTKVTMVIAPVKDLKAFY
jgi:hypothetical protein